MTSFHVGQKVVCINASGFEDRLMEGAIYTVSDVGVDFGELYLGLEETIAVSPGPLHWLATRFRPVVDRKSDISIFTSMLNPSWVEELA
jgi:hypothetical protein